MWDLEYSGQFKKDLKRMVKRGADIDDIRTALGYLARDGQVPVEYQPACDGTDNYIFIPYMGWYGTKGTNEAASKRKEWNSYFYHWTKDLATQTTKDSTGDGQVKTGGYVWQLNDEGTKAVRTGWDLSSLGWMVCLGSYGPEWPNGYDRCFGFKIRPVKDK